MFSSASSTGRYRQSPEAGEKHLSVSWKLEKLKRFSFCPHLCRRNDCNFLEIIVRHVGISDTRERKEFLSTLRNAAADQTAVKECSRSALSA